MRKKVRRLMMLAGVLMTLCSLYELKVKPMRHDKTIQEEVESIETRIETASRPDNTEAAEVLAEVIPEEPQFNFPMEEITEYKTALPWETSTKKEILDYPSVGFIEINSVDISVPVRYSSKDTAKSNLDNAACITEFSKGERVYILGHNYENSTHENRIFHNLLDVKEGDIVSLTLLRNIGDDEIATEYKYKVVFSKRYSQDEFYEDNAKILTDNPDFSDDFNLCLATCNHDDTGRGRQVVFCQLIEE